MWSGEVCVAELGGCVQLASFCCLSKRSAVGTGILVLVEIEGGSFLVVIAVVGSRELDRGSNDGKLNSSC